MGTYGGTTGSTGTRGSPPHGYRVAPTLVAMGDVRRVCGDAWLLQAHQSFARSGCDLLDNRKWPLLKTVDDDVCIHGSQRAYMYCKPPYLNHTVHRNAVPASLQRCDRVGSGRVRGAHQPPVVVLHPLACSAPVTAPAKGSGNGRKCDKCSIMYRRLARTVYVRLDVS